MTSLLPPRAAMSQAVAKLLNYRSQLAKLTDPSTDETRLTPSTRKWDSNTVQVREEARRLAAVVEGTTRITFSRTNGIKAEWKSASSIFRGVNCTVSNIIPSSKRTSTAKDSNAHSMISEDGRY